VEDFQTAFDRKDGVVGADGAAIAESNFHCDVSIALWLVRLADDEPGSTKRELMKD
jgi:hypothetical protein